MALYRPTYPRSAERIQMVSAILKRYQENYKIGHRPKSIEWVQDCSTHLLDTRLIADLDEQTHPRFHEDSPCGRAPAKRTVNIEVDQLSPARFGSTWRVLWRKGELLTAARENRSSTKRLTN